eukprot:TRINITY_DN5574_c0_g1_i1.p1 TRINITY_DN5574_c0_g1~~TRINITY_DN5574_c0_g1_i1.p1  ORF type:complete len:292 (+),score=57.71 TRINITY_DN5574_c0_g1_i1:533-1408(+)
MASSLRQLGRRVLCRRQGLTGVSQSQHNSVGLWARAFGTAATKAGRTPEKPIELPIPTPQPPPQPVSEFMQEYQEPAEAPAVVVARRAKPAVVKKKVADEEKKSLTERAKEAVMGGKKETDPQKEKESMSATQLGVNAFFDLTNPRNVVPKTGRSWRAKELRLKSFEDLHRLWHILLIERNMLETEKFNQRRLTAQRRGNFRLRKVRKSMARIKVVLGERQRAYQQYLRDQTPLIDLSQLPNEPQALFDSESKGALDMDDGEGEYDEDYEYEEEGDDDIVEGEREPVGVKA